MVAPTGAIAEMLFGDWWGSGDIGNCFDVRNWYSFASDGTVVNRQIDHNACSGNRLVSKADGTYSLDGRRLELRLVGMGSERPFDMHMPTKGVTKRTDTLTIAMGAASMIAGRDPQVFLDGRAFTSDDGVAFVSKRGTVMSAYDTSLVFMQAVFITLQLNPGLPLAEGEHTRVQVEANLSTFDGAGDGMAHSALVTFAYDATIREELGWLRIMPDALDGLDGQAAIDAWHRVLDDNGVTSQPEWARRLLEAEFYPSQRFQAGNISLLTSTLPEWGRWTQSAEPPPIL